MERREGEEVGERIRTEGRREAGRMRKRDGIKKGESGREKVRVKEEDEKKREKRGDTQMTEEMRGKKEIGRKKMQTENE